jgi:hypothetical protein
MQWQLIPETTMHAFDNALLTMIAINKLTDRSGVSKISFFGIIYVSLSSKAIKSNTQNLCISPLRKIQVDLCQKKLIVGFSGTAACVFLLPH